MISEYKRKTKVSEGVLQLQLDPYHLKMFNILMKKYKVKPTAMVRILINEEFHRLEKRNAKVAD